MKITVKLFADLREFAPGDKTAGKNQEIEIAPASTINDLLVRLGIPAPRAKVVFVNGRSRELSFALSENDEVGVFPPVGGG